MTSIEGTSIAANVTSETEDQKLLMVSNERTQPANDHTVTGPSHGNGFMDSTPEISKSRFRAATGSADAHTGPVITEKQSEVPKSERERSCCSAPKEDLSVRGAETSVGSGAFFPPREANSKRFSSHHPSTSLSKTIEDPPREIPYLHNPPIFDAPDIPQASVYNMAHHYGNATQPLTPTYIQQHGDVYSGPVSHYAPVGAIAPLAESTSILGVTDTCTCGPSCQCVFCVAHPYNATTRDRVQTLAHLLPDDADYSPQSPPYPSFFHSIDDPTMAAPVTNNMHLSGIVHPSHMTPSVPFHGPSFSNDIYDALPTDIHQAPQSAISSGYFTMEYQFDPTGFGGCTDATGTCRCGDECTCIGCLTHTGHEGGRF